MTTGVGADRKLTPLGQLSIGADTRASQRTRWRWRSFASSPAPAICTTVTGVFASHAMRDKLVEFGMVVAISHERSCW
jgi:hypothetical protein